jgi:hypothetical protein
MTTSDLIQKLAEGDGIHVERDLTGAAPRLVMKDGKGKEICTVLETQLDDLCRQSYLERVEGKWRLSADGKAAGERLAKRHRGA